MSPGSASSAASSRSRPAQISSAAIAPRLPPAAASAATVAVRCSLNQRAGRKRYTSRAPRSKLRSIACRKRMCSSATRRPGWICIAKRPCPSAVGQAGRSHCNARPCLLGALRGRAAATQGAARHAADPDRRRAKGDRDRCRHRVLGSLLAQQPRHHVQRAIAARQHAGRGQQASVLDEAPPARTRTFGTAFVSDSTAAEYTAATARRTRG